MKRKGKIKHMIWKILRQAKLVWKNELCQDKCAVWNKYAHMIEGNHHILQLFPGRKLGRCR